MRREWDRKEKGSREKEGMEWRNKTRNMDE